MRGGKSPNSALYSLILLKISLFYSQGRIALNRWYVVRVTMARERTNPVEEGLTEEINITRALHGEIFLFSLELLTKRFELRIIRITTTHRAYAPGTF